MKIIASLCFLIFTSSGIYAQIQQSELTKLHIIEDSLIAPSNEMIQSEMAENRMLADSLFTRMLVRALKVPNSFYYPFDSIKTVSKLYAPDSTFRIFTWQIIIHNDLVRQKGAIQMRTNDGSLKLFPLIDMSDQIENVEDTITSNLAWIGAIYYKILHHKRDNENIYTLLGFDENNIRSTKKYIEILKFIDGKPVFGAFMFTVPNNTLKPKTSARFIMEYKKLSSARLLYDEDLQMIIKEHLVSETNEPNKKYTLVGDGDYEAFKWMDNTWQYISKVFTYVTPENQPPVPSKILNDNGANENMFPEDIPETKSNKNKSGKKKGGN
jgi:hypothetical protein